MLSEIHSDYKRVSRKLGGKGLMRRLVAAGLGPGFQAALGYRFSRWSHSRIPFVHIPVQRTVEILTGVSIPPSVRIGPGLLIEHFGGIVVNAGTIIGANCTISHGVTIGNKEPGGGAPTIGDNVYICTGAKVLGDITIGDNVIIGAGAVVLDSVPENSIVAGVPARVLRTYDPTKERAFHEGNL